LQNCKSRWKASRGRAASDDDASAAQLIISIAVLVGRCNRVRKTASRSPPICSRAGGFGRLAAVVVAGHGAIGLCGVGSRFGGISAAGGGSSVEQLPPFGAKNRGNRGIISPPQHTTTGCIGGQGGAERAAKHSLKN